MHTKKKQQQRIPFKPKLHHTDKTTFTKEKSKHQTIQNKSSKPAAWKDADDCITSHCIMINTLTEKRLYTQ